MDYAVYKIPFFIFGLNIVYGILSKVLIDAVTSNWLMIVLMTGYVMIFVSILQKFGNNSIVKGAILGLISAVGTMFGWVVASLIL
ncbi:hypothetical protein [Thermococcus sp.]